MGTQTFFVCNGAGAGAGAGQGAACVNTRRGAFLHLPLRFGLRHVRAVRVRINGRNQFRRVRSGRRVFVSTAGLQCGVFPVAVFNRRVRPALRIWSLTGGRRLVRFTIGNVGRPNLG